MKKRIIFTAIFSGCLLCSPRLFAQWHFRSVNSLQVLQGKRAVSAAVHSVNGWGHGRFFAGIGTGLDAYRQTTIPLFLEGRARLAGQRRQLEGWLNAGLHIPLKSDRLVFVSDGPLQPGWLQAAGLDYLVPLKKLQAMVGLGYSRKAFGQEVTEQIWNPATSRLETVQRKNRYAFNRIALRVGLVF
jgi:hypothetical protein